MYTFSAEAKQTGEPVLIEVLNSAAGKTGRSRVKTEPNRTGEELNLMNAVDG